MKIYNETLLEIRKNAILRNIPILKDDTLEFIIDLIKKNKFKKILEIGSAVGYSAINFALAGALVVTIEKKEDMYNEALKNINKMKLSDKIKIILNDAAIVDIKEKFDFIFIDGPKGQYENHFNKFAKNLKKNGIIICDNINFHNLKPDEVSKRTQKLLEKISNFKTFLLQNKEYETHFLAIGDGISISKFKGEL